MDDAQWAKPERTTTTESRSVVSLQKSPEDVTDLENSPVDEELVWSDRTISMYRWLFAIMGFAELFYWNCILQIMADVAALYPEQPTMSDTLNATNMLSQLVVVAFNIWTGAMNQKVIVTCAFLMALGSILTAFTVQWARGMTGVVLIHLCNVLMGGANGFFQSGSFGLAAAVPGTMTIGISTGQGLCGVLTFVLYLPLSMGRMAGRTKTTLWILMALAAFFLLIAGFTYLKLIRNPVISRRVHESQEALKNDTNAPSYWSIFKETKWCLLLLFWCMTVSLYCFPNIGPIRWNQSSNMITVIIGMFQVGDLVGRYAVSKLSFLVMPLWLMKFLNPVRVIYIVVFCLMWNYNTNGFWGSPALGVIVMLVLSISNGMHITSVFIEIPTVLEDKNYISRASSLALLGQLFGIAAGLWLAKLTFIIVE